MPDNWISTSEIVAGKIIQGKLSLNAVRPQLFIEPYDKIIELMQKGIKEREELISRVGFGPVSAALDAANTASSDHMDWIVLLEKISAKCQLADKLRRHAKKLDNGEDVDSTEVIEDFRQLDGKKPYMTPLDEIEERTNPFMDSGWPALDKEFCGIPRSGLITVGAATKVGKTSWLTQLADYVAIRYPEKKVGIFTLEMLADEYKHRVLQLCETLDLKTGETIAMDRERQHRIVVDDSAGMSVQEVANKAAREPNLGLVGVDFADLMVQEENSEASMAKIYLTLSNLAKSLSIPVVLLSQFNRTYNGGVPLPRHIRYCVTGDTLIPNPITGARIRADQFPWYVWSLDESWKLVKKPCRISLSGKQPIYKITTQSGHSIKVSEHHPFLTGLQWTEAKDLKINDTVAVASCLPEPEMSIPISPEKARLLGYMIGDGYMPARSKGGLTYMEWDNQVVEDFIYCLNKEFPEMKAVIRYVRHCFRIELSNLNGYQDGPKVNQFNQWLENLGVRGQKSYTFRIPAEVFGWSSEGQANFLRGLFTADGSISKQGRIKYYSKSNDLLLDVKSLLIRLGVRSWLSAECELTLAERENVKRFSTVIGFSGRKQTKLLDYLFTSQQKLTQSNPLPLSFTQIIREAGNRHLTTTRRISVARAKQLLPLDHSLRKAVDANIHWDLVTNIEILPEEETYDFEVPEDHNFIANDFITHNTGMAEALSWMLLVLYNPAKDMNATADGVITLSAAPGKAYTVGWLIRGGFLKHEDDNPGAIQMSFSGKRGWGKDSLGWMKLHTEQEK